MKTRISTKNLSIEKQNLSRGEESLVKRYESLYFRVYLFTFIFRTALFVSTIGFISFTVYLYKNPDLWASTEKSLAVFSSLFNLLSVIGYALMRNVNKTSFKAEINELEDEIVKEKLRGKFGLSDQLKDEIEDFYIELNNLTKAKYETAFKFYTYEFYIYTVISSLIAVFFLSRIF
jgi:hypothetical protein